MILYQTYSLLIKPINIKYEVKKSVNILFSSAPYSSLFIAVSVIFLHLYSWILISWYNLFHVMICITHSKHDLRFIWVLPFVYFAYFRDFSLKMYHHDAEKKINFKRKGVSTNASFVYSQNL